MSLPPIKIPTDSSTFSPLAIEALKLLPKFYLYPSLLQLKAITENGSTTVEFRIRPFTWRLIPWLFNVVVFIGLLTVGSCVFVLARALFMETEYKVKISTMFILIAFAVSTFLHTVACWVLRGRPDVADVVNYFIMFELECKIT